MATSPCQCPSSLCGEAAAPQCPPECAGGLQEHKQPSGHILMLPVRSYCVGKTAADDHQPAWTRGTPRAKCGGLMQTTFGDVSVLITRWSGKAGKVSMTDSPSDVLWIILTMQHHACCIATLACDDGSRTPCPHERHLNRVTKLQLLRPVFGPDVGEVGSRRPQVLVVAHQVYVAGALHGQHSFVGASGLSCCTAVLGQGLLLC